MLKSPAMNEALKPIHRLEAEAAKQNEINCAAYKLDIDAFALRKSVAASLTKSKLKEENNSTTKIDLGLGPEPEEPAVVRYCTNDSTYEGLGELLISNPTGILVERDELISLLKHLDKEDQASARGFYLGGAEGSSAYSFDRIVRGHRHVGAICISTLGNTQPVRAMEYVRSANLGGAGGDGLIQRFGLMAWPDASASWVNVDRYPNGHAREQAWQAFERASKLDLDAALKMGAHKGEYDSVPYFRFSEGAHAEFLEWRTGWEARLRSGDLSPALEGHFAKYRKLVPALALMNHTADQGQIEVSQSDLLKALAFSEYLESHARRVYSCRDESEVAAAKAILQHIRAGRLKDGFTAREVYRSHWAHLTETAEVSAGQALLVEHHFIAPVVALAGSAGGRPTTSYMINPRLKP